MTAEQQAIIDYFRSTLADRKEDLGKACKETYGIHPYDDLVKMQEVLYKLVDVYATNQQYTMTVEEKTTCRDSIYNTIMGI